MENASKALLIAGAILIAILLIAIGMMVFNSASGVVDSAASGMTSHEKTLYNKKFEGYAGVVTGSQVKALINTIEENNSNPDNPKFTGIRFYQVSGGSRVDTGTSTVGDIVANPDRIQRAKALVNNNTMYMVRFGDKVDSINGDDDGLLSCVNIYLEW